MLDVVNLQNIFSGITVNIEGFEVVVDEKRKTAGEITLPTAGTSRAMAYDFYYYHS